MTSQQAIDLMMARIQAAWAGASAIVGYVPVIEWPDTQMQALPDASKFFLRVATQFETAQQISLGRPALWHTKGTLYAQVYAPRSDLKAAFHGRALAEAVSNSFVRVTEPGGLWYRDAVAREYRPEQNWMTYRAQVSFEFDDLRT